MRKSIALKVDNQGNIIIKAPFFITKNSINNFVEKNYKWIEKRRSEMKEKISFNFECGDEIFYLGEKCKINKKEKIKEKIRFKDDNFYLDKNLNKTEAKELIINFYKKQAKIYIIERTKYFIEKYDLTVNSIKIGSAKTRWGTCNSKKNIRFTYYLMFAPKESIDYVIIHELAHLKEMNHSKKFWSEVERMMSDYKVYKFWFKENKGISLF